LAAALLFATLPSCSSRFCALTGCLDVIRVTLTQTQLLGDAKTIRACWNNRCYTVDAVDGEGNGDTAIRDVRYVAKDHRVTIAASGEKVLMPTDVLALTIAAASGEILVDWSGPIGRLRSSYPNGEGCGGECFAADLRVP
jgi:hypothetical protein